MIIICIAKQWSVKLSMNETHDCDGSSSDLPEIKVVIWKVAADVKNEIHLMLYFD